jgi:hypothetical protein
MSEVNEYLTAFTVYLDDHFQARIDLAPTLREGYTVQRAATDHDFDVAVLWVSKYREKKA